MPLIEFARVNSDLPFRIEFDVDTIQWPGRWPFAINSVTVKRAAITEAAAMTRTLKLVLFRLPIRCASHVRASPIEHIEPLWIACNTDSMLLQKLRVYSNPKIRQTPNLKDNTRLKDFFRWRPQGTPEH